MVPTGHNIVELGIKLLKEKKIAISAFAEAFSLAGVTATELKLAPLKSVFGGDRYFEPKELSAFDINYPTLDSIDYFNNVTLDVIGNCLASLERFGSFVATDIDNTIPVYDLFKTAAAIQNCLNNELKDNPFLLVSADFSGIQDTVYTISSKGALKTLRARSFMLELLTEHIVYEILHACGSERYAIIYSGGGGFSLLLPNIAGNVKAIDGYREVLNKWALQEFSGKFFIAMDALVFNEEKLKDKGIFKKLRQEQSDNLDRQKSRKFLRQLDKLFKPEMPEQVNLQTECQITRRDDLPNKEMRDLGSGEKMPEHNPDMTKTWVSESCYRQYRLGDKLIGTKYVCRRKIAKDDRSGFVQLPTMKSTPTKLSFCYYVVSSKLIHNSDAIWCINSWTERESSRTLLYSNYVRKYGDLTAYTKKLGNESHTNVEERQAKDTDTATFEGLAASSCGADLIGALRMDVDNMGDLFRNIESFAALSTKSRMLNLFFKVYLNQICAGHLGSRLSPTDIVGKNYTEKNAAEENKGRNVSVIYAGGDDLFILGAWDETTELAFDIQRCFALFTGGMFDTTKKIISGGQGISGGLTLHQPKFPLYQMAIKSGEAESVAKHAKVQKNCFTPFLLALDHVDKGYEFYNNQTVRIIDWNDPTFFGLLENLVVLTEKHITGNQIDTIKLEAVSKGFIYKLFEVARVWVAEGTLYLPRLRYIFSRLEKQYIDNKDTHKQAGIQSLRSILFSSIKHEREKSIKRMTLTLNWFEQLQRNK